MRAEGKEKMNRQRRTTKVKGRAASENIARADRTFEKDWWKQKAIRQEGRSRSRLIREIDNGEKEIQHCRWRAESQVKR